VTLAYELFDAEGELVEKSDPGPPLVLLVGYGQAVPALESALAGLAVGRTARVALAPEDAFGRRDPAAIIEVDRADFPADIAPGDELEADRESGGSVTLKVLEVTNDLVVLDTNHPLAGQRVELSMTLTAVRPATPAEIETATRALTGEPAAASAPLLPVERLLRRRPAEPPENRDEPAPPTPGRSD
jgi:FKBP-type peptidyl-prolyl cis-trans isomerase SlyD